MGRGEEGRGETPELEMPGRWAWEARWGQFSQPQRPLESLGGGEAGEGWVGLTCLRVKGSTRLPGGRGQKCQPANGN